MIFPGDLMTPRPHEPDIDRLVHADYVRNVSSATHPAGARVLLRDLTR